MSCGDRNNRPEIDDSCRRLIPKITKINHRYGKSRFGSQRKTDHSQTGFATFAQMKKTANLYLIPTTLGDTEPGHVVPATLVETVRSLRYFIVENVRTARRYLKKLDRDIDIDALEFMELNKHTDRKQLERFLHPVLNGNDTGIISEAGCPGVADPGADVVKLAHEKDIRVIPMVGPSSILLSLMASGMNGQNFAFVGYLPIPKGERQRAIKDLERRSATEHQTQIFIEAPYRNMKLLEDILQACHDQTRLCIAADITLESEYIKTQSVAQWKKGLPELHKRPAIFLLHKD